MRPSTLRRPHAAGRPIVNAWLSISSPYAAELVAHQGFDAATVDVQHGMIGFEGAVAMVQATANTGAIPLVWPGENDPARIMRLLEAGAYGVICPMVSTAAAQRLAEGFDLVTPGNDAMLLRGAMAAAVRAACGE